jgi:hypothetical protein
MREELETDWMDWHGLARSEGGGVRLVGVGWFASR